MSTSPACSIRDFGSFSITLLPSCSLVCWKLASWKTRIREDNIKMNLGKSDVKDGRRMELAQDRVQWRVLVSVVLNHMFFSRLVSFSLVST